MSDTENIQDLINERNNQNKRIEQLVLEIERLNNIINEADTKNLELIQKINKIYDVIENKNITGIGAKVRWS